MKIDGVNDMSSSEGKQHPTDKPGKAALEPKADDTVTTTMTIKADVEQPFVLNERQSGLEASDALGRQLKQVYGKLLSEPVPDKFYELLRRLDQHPTAVPKTDGGRETK